MFFYNRFKCCSILVKRYPISVRYFDKARNMATGKAPYMELNDGNKIPVLALGTGGMRTGKGELVADVPMAILWAIEAGYRHIDTATLYANEDIVGDQIATAIAKGLVTREQLFITTKLPRSRNSRDQVIPTLKESLARLKTDYVDLYLIHEPISCMEDGTLINIDYVETWKAMEVAKDLGLTRSIGVSNFNQERLDRILGSCKIKPAVNQIEVHPAMTEENLVAHCHKHGIAVMAYCPLGYVAERRRPDSVPPYADDPVLTKIANKYGKTTVQVVLRYSIDRGLIAVPKSTNKDRIAQNIDIFDFKLTDEEVSAISRFNQDYSVMDPIFWKRLEEFPF